MNLTSKRMLQLMAGCAGALALTASADTTTYVADHFEYIGEAYGTTNGSAGLAIGKYKCQPEGTYLEVTNFQWFADNDDASAIVSNTSAYAGTVRPIAGADTILALNLDTNGKTLVRTNNASLDFSAAAVYVDTLIKFTPSEDIPTISDPSVKAAVFVGTNQTLWVYHGVGGPGSASAVSSDTLVSVNTSDWHRLTIMLGKLPETDADYAFQVYVDQNLISCAAGMQSDGTTSPGPWFWSASALSTFNAVAFQGTGMIDELVVADAVNLGSPSATWLTLSFTSSEVSVLTSGVAIANLDSVKDGSSISIIAKPWYQITDGGALLVNATTNVFDSTTAITGIVATITGVNGQTNTVTSAAFSGTTGLPAGYGDADITDLMAWATAKNVTPEGLTEAMLDDYLLNVDPATDAVLKITKMTYGATTVTIEIEATSASVDLTAINGVLNIWTAAELGAPTTWSAVTHNITVPTSSKLTVTVATNLGSYIKASVNTVSEIVE